MSHLSPLDVDDAETYRSAITSCAVAMSVVAQYNLPGLVSRIERAHALGPILDPTLYRAKVISMEEDRRIVEAALPLFRLAMRLRGALETPPATDR